MHNFLAGALGALAPEIIRWRRIARSETPDEWRHLPYWFTTLAYVALAGFLASLVAQPNGYAAFITGLTTEYAIAGVLDEGRGRELEELGTAPATWADLVLSTLRRHATYLTQNG
jgi:hypothetical protein